MPVRTYTEIDVTALSPQGGGGGTGTIDQINGTWQNSGLAPVISTGSATTLINFLAFPTIPSTAIITKIEVKGTWVAAATGVGSAIGAGGFILGDGAFFTPPFVVAWTTTAPGGNYAFVAFSDPSGSQGKTVADLIADNINSFHSGGVTGVAVGQPASFTWTHSNWRLEITYDLENYSWYIKPTEQIINGLPVTIIEDADEDIVAIADGDPIPEGYIRYGSGDDFPSGPEYVWWESPDFWELYILSPINPSVPGITVWTLVGGVPTCVDCLTLELGSLEILIADGSGIYTLSSTARNDTVYRRAEGDTVEVKIPNPFIDTGFVP